MPLRKGIGFCQQSEVFDLNQTLLNFYIALSIISTHLSIPKTPLSKHN